MKFLINTLTIVFLLLSGCSGTILIDDGDTMLSDISLTDEINTEPDTNSSDTAIDEKTDISLDNTNIELCDKNEACNNLLTEESFCEGSCIYQEHSCSCNGKPFNNLCYLFEIPTKPEYKDLIDDIRIVAPEIPEYVYEGVRFEIELTLTNTASENRTLNYGYTNPENWEIEAFNFEPSGTLYFEPKETKRLRFDAIAIHPDIFIPYYTPIITFSFNDSNYELYSKILFSEKEGYLKCGTKYFPSSYCTYQDCSGYSNYNSAVCCNEIFYPGATCCTDEDCIDGVCIDGKCTFRVPGIFLANTTLIQNNRILIILSDFDEFEERDLCKNKYDTLRDALQIDVIENFYKKIILNRTDREDIIHFKWEVLSGFKSERFINNNQYDFQSFKDALNNYINTELGCNIDFEEYDKLIIISPKIDLMGFGGMAFGNGFIGQILYSNGYLTAHELAHSFGATDLYLDLGGTFQYSLSLMGNNLGGYGFPEDKVMWGEIGLSDINQNGIIDLFEFARYPEKIIIENLKANLTYKDSIEISFEPYLLENNQLKRGIFNSYTIELPEYNVIRDIYYDPFIAFDQSEIDLNKIKERGKILIKIGTKYRYSDKDFKNRKLSFEELFEVEVGWRKR